MADSENRDTHPKRKPRSISIRLTRNLVLYYRQSASGARNGDHRRKSDAEKLYEKIKEEAWKKPIELIGVIIVFAYTCATFYQGCQMRTATNSAVAQNQISIDAQRPWVGIGKVKILDPLIHGHPMMVLAPRINVGHTPALYSDAWADLVPMFLRNKKGEQLYMHELAECIGPKRKWGEKLTGSILLPNMYDQNLPIVSNTEVLPDWMVDTIMRTAPPPTPIPPITLKMFRLPDDPDFTALTIGLVGCTEYFDEWHNAHRTNFCLQYIPIDGVFSPCSTGNYAD